MNVGYTKINIDSWKRKEHFTAYRDSVKCGFSLTVKLDISEVIAFVKERGYKFYPVMIYLLTKAANQHAEFKMAMKDGELIVWDYIDPVYTVLHTDTETFSALTLSHSDSLMDFIDRYNELFHKNKNNKSFFPDKAPDNHFNISSLPWIYFDSFNLNIADFTDYFAPSFTIGKYQMEGNKILMPLAIQVHHAVCDGIHVAKLIDTLQEYSNTVQIF
ncbi:CatA-like O-acetyltransferase [Flavobacterium sp. HSC-61S13]|uniref:CatA-like O-acetyltransferase n=1 Tax=Flavobacterium sp. HSC-61S13 TaxID=2910963 RepID=UPI00209CC80A|nr:CatA-like O-acetyltransferase [Flavobacterium sp. HSC-61S13]MCP1997350.1 chloramphenicol O-acetyltransferase type A [Flavobacterium sp. HSC-61S13]